MFRLLSQAFAWLSESISVSSIDASVVVSQLIHDGHRESLREYWLSDWDDTILMVTDGQAYQDLQLYGLLGTAELKEAIQLLT